MQSKSEVFAKISQSTGVSKTDVKMVFEAFGDLALNELKSSDKAQVLLPEVGTLRKSYRAERQGRNPQTGESMTIAATYAPVMRFRKGFKDGIND